MKKNFSTFQGDGIYRISVNYPQEGQYRAFFLEVCFHSHFSKTNLEWSFPSLHISAMRRLLQEVSTALKTNSQKTNFWCRHVGLEWTTETLCLQHKFSSSRRSCPSLLVKAPNVREHWCNYCGVEIDTVTLSNVYSEKIYCHCFIIK